MTAHDTIRVESVVQRKHPSLPRFVVVPSDAIAIWRLTGTTVVEAGIDDVDVGRRTLKPWGPDRDAWFVDLTEAQCAKAGVDTGDPVAVTLSLASTELPIELAALLDADPGAASAWRALTSARQRQLAEHVRSAKRPETRARRARQALPGSSGP